MDAGYRTLGDLKKAGMDLALQCKSQRCQMITPDMDYDNGIKRPKIGIDVLIDRLGKDHSYLENNLRPHLRCSRCGQYNAGLTILQPDIYTP